MGGRNRNILKPEVSAVSMFHSYFSLYLLPPFSLPSFFHSSSSFPALFPLLIPLSFSSIFPLILPSHLFLSPSEAYQLLSKPQDPKHFQDCHYKLVSWSESQASGFSACSKGQMLYRAGQWPTEKAGKPTWLSLAPVQLLLPRHKLHAF